MSNEWAEMLISVGIEADMINSPKIEESLDAGYSAVQLHDLSDLLVVDVTGADARSFLQGQFCNDLQQVSVARAQVTGYCTPKGRLLALPTIVGTRDGFRLLIKSDVKEAFIKRLSMFIMRSEVEIKDRFDLVCSGVMADSTGGVGELDAGLGALPAAPMDVATSEASQLIRWHDDQLSESRARYIQVSEKSLSFKFWENHAAVLKRTHARWRAGDITAGIPSIFDQTKELFVPQMLNLQLIGALSFTKGCYPGQEIVARMQYLGKLKRHMRLFKTSLNEANVAAGSRLSAGEDENAGTVIDAISMTEIGANESGSGFTLLLAVVKVSAGVEALRLGELALQSLNLPYDLPSLNVDGADLA